MSPQLEEEADAIRLFASRKRKHIKLAADKPDPNNSVTDAFSKRRTTASVEQDCVDDRPTCSTADETATDVASAPEASGSNGLTSQSHSFKALGISDWLCNVCKSLGMSTATQVQQGCIPPILQGRDVIGLAQTGSGKTAAFALPILQQLAADPYGVFALVLTPTRELAFQIAEQFQALGAGMTVKECVVVGGMDSQQQARDLAKRPHVVIATPGRLMDLLDNAPGVAPVFARARFLVMDEADRLLDPSFEGALRTVLSALPAERQTLLFSATMTQSLVKLQSAALSNAFVFEAYQGLKTADQLREEYVFVPAKVKDVYLFHLLSNLQDYKVRSAIIFAGTCRSCHLLSLLLEELGMPCAVLHSGKPQKARLAALQRFKGRGVPLLLATDVASRGLDIPTVDLVINFDLPMLARDYVHRVGRTARAGRPGWSVSFVTQYDVALVHAIEELLDHKLAPLELEEAEVLKSITKVYSAKRAAMLRAAEQDGLDAKKSKQFVKKLMKD